MRLSQFSAAVLAALLSAWPLILSASSEGDRREISFGVVPQFSPEEIYRNWTPVLTELGDRTDCRYRLVSFESIPEFEKAFIEGEVDLAYANPYHVLMGYRAQRYTPIIRDGKRRLSGVLVVRKDSGIANLKELDGAVVAFPGPNAFGASLYMRALLQRTYGVTIQPQYVLTHSNVYRHVLSERTLAGGGVMRTLQREPDSLKAQLRVLYETPKTYPHAIMIHPRIEEELGALVLEAWLQMGLEPSDSEMLANIQLTEPVKADIVEYTKLEELELDTFAASH